MSIIILTPVMSYELPFLSSNNPAPFDYGAPVKSSYGSPGSSDYGAPVKTSYGATGSSDYGAPVRSEYGAPVTYDKLIGNNINNL